MRLECTQQPALLFSRASAAGFCQGDAITDGCEKNSRLPLAALRAVCQLHSQTSAGYGSSSLLQGHRPLQANLEMQKYPRGRCDFSKKVQSSSGRFLLISGKKN